MKKISFLWYSLKSPLYAVDIAEAILMEIPIFFQYNPDRLVSPTPIFNANRLIRAANNANYRSFKSKVYNSIKYNAWPPIRSNQVLYFVGSCLITVFMLREYSQIERPTVRTPKSLIRTCLSRRLKSRICHFQN